MKKEALKWTVSYAAIQFFFWFAYGTALAYASPYLLACAFPEGDPVRPAERHAAVQRRAGVHDRK